MMKSLPEEVSLAFLELVNMSLKHNMTISSWTKELMLLIQKVPGNASLLKIRPLKLLEVLRKAMFGILKNRVQEVWEKLGLLSTHQYGFRAGRSTRQPLFNLGLVTQHALLFRKDLHVVFQDIRRAFDSVEPTLGKEMSMRRLGVPEFFIDLMLDYDAGVPNTFERT